MSLRTLDPPPTVSRGAVAFIATAAGRTEAGTKAVVQVGNGVPRAADALLLSSSAERREFGAHFGALAGLPTTVAEGALLELLAEVEAALRALPDDEPWMPPVPLSAAAVPPFPTAALPSWVRAQVEGVAAAVQVPPDLPAMLALAGISLCVARRVVVCPWDGWSEPLNLYTMTVLASGNRKSAAFEPMLAPFEIWEEAEKARIGEAIAAAQSRQRMLEAALHRVEAAAAKATGQEHTALVAEAQESAKELRSLRVPVEPRLLADDATVEKLGQLLAEQHGRIGIFASEGDVLDLMSGRYSDGMPNIGVYLRGHSGDTHRVDRLNRPAEYVRRPAIAIGISVQPEVLAGLKARPTLHGRGLLARFLYALPVSLLGRRATKALPLPASVSIEYERRISQLLAIEPPLDEESRAMTHNVTFAPEASTRFEGFCQQVEGMLAPEGELAHMSDWGGKFAGAVARVIGVLHLAARSDEAQPWTTPVAASVVDDGLAIAEYLLAHGRVAFAEMGADPATAVAEIVRDWVLREKLESFSKRDAWRALRGRFGRAADLDAPLAMLVEHGYLREQEARPRVGRGRKPSQVYLVNPLGQNGQNGQNRQVPEGMSTGAAGPETAPNAEAAGQKTRPRCPA
ncbi:MAG TPA: YfjI family protein [Chloroflexota bacterium]|nr:YfjI family protein [Chloroflexota bacterium]